MLKIISTPKISELSSMGSDPQVEFVMAKMEDSMAMGIAMVMVLQTPNIKFHLFPG